MSEMTFPEQRAESGRDMGLKGNTTMRLPGVRVIGGTLTPALGATNAAHGFAEQDEKRKALNEFIRASGST
jgi:hypothetical protein